MLLIKQRMQVLYRKHINVTGWKKTLLYCEHAEAEKTDSASKSWRLVSTTEVGGGHRSDRTIADQKYFTRPLEMFSCLSSSLHGVLSQPRHEQTHGDLWQTHLSEVYAKKGHSLAHLPRSFPFNSGTICCSLFLLSSPSDVDFRPLFQTSSYSVSPSFRGGRTSEHLFRLKKLWGRSG